MDSFFDLVIDTLLLPAKVILNCLGVRLYVIVKYALIVGIDSARDFFDVAHDLTADLVGGVRVADQTFLAIFLKCSDLWHVLVVKDIERLWENVHGKLLREGRSVWVADHRSLQVEAAVFQKSIRKGRYVVSRIALPYHVKFLVYE